MCFILNVPLCKKLKYMSACQRTLTLVFYNYLCVFSAKNVDKHSMKPI